MKAIIQTAYGSPGTFELREIPAPSLKRPDDVLINVHAAAIHAGDVFMMRGVPVFTRFVVGFPTPRNYIPGFDVAGVVTAVGDRVTQLKPGDRVYGTFPHTCAEVVVTRATKLAHVPSNLSLSEAAAVPVSASAALIGIRDVGKVRSGMKVLINGASGGVGTYAVQIAKVYGAEVTGVCSGKNEVLVRSIGADHVIDYTRQDFTDGEARYDVILDQVANHPLAAYRRVLTPSGRYIPNSGHSGMPFILKSMLASIFIRQQASTYFAEPKPRDLAALTQLIEAGKLKPIIDRTYALAEASDAFAYLNEGHARGKVVLIMPDAS